MSPRAKSCRCGNGGGLSSKTPTLALRCVRQDSGFQKRSTGGTVTNPTRDAAEEMRTGSQTFNMLSDRSEKEIQ